MFINTDVTFVCMQMTTVLKLVFVLQLNLFPQVLEMCGQTMVWGPSAAQEAFLKSALKKFYQ